MHKPGKLLLKLVQPGSFFKTTTQSETAFEEKHFSYTI